MQGARWVHDVALAGNLALVGGPFLDSPETDRGVAYVFDVTTGLIVHELLASDGAADDRFGGDVDLAGTLGAIGAHLHDDHRGAVYLFDVVSGAELTKLTAVGGEKNDSLGDALDFDGDRLAVGASITDDLGPGSVFVFDVGAGTQLVELHASDGTYLDRFGISVALDGGLLASGAYGVDEQAQQAGAAYLFAALDCSLTRTCDPAVPNSTGMPAVLDVMSCSATQGAALLARNLPPDKFGYLLVGTGNGVVQPPGSSGNLCLAGAPIGRYAADLASSGALGRIATHLVFGPTGGGTGELPNPPPAPSPPARAGAFNSGTGTSAERPTSPTAWSSSLGPDPAQAAPLHGGDWKVARGVSDRGYKPLSEKGLAPHPGFEGISR